MAVRAVLDTKQVGQILGVSDETVKRYLADGKVEGFRLPGVGGEFTPTPSWR